MAVKLTAVAIATAVMIAQGAQSALAQQPHTLPVIGYLGGNRSVLDAFVEGLRALGYVAGKNFHLEARLTAASAADQRRFAAERVAMGPRVIVATGTASVDVAKLTSTIPIVLTATPESTALRIIKHLDRPDGNVTGVVGRESERIRKELSLLKEVVPGLTRVAMLADANLPRPLVPEILAPSMALRLTVASVSSVDQFAAAFDWLAADAARGHTVRLITSCKSSMAPNQAICRSKCNKSGSWSSTWAPRDDWV